jgi:hypothetical protein
MLFIQSLPLAAYGLWEWVDCDWIYMNNFLKKNTKYHHIDRQWYKKHTSKDPKYKYYQHIYRRISEILQKINNFTYTPPYGMQSQRIILCIKISPYWYSLNSILFYIYHLLVQRTHNHIRKTDPLCMWSVIVEYGEDIWTEMLSTA